MQSFIEQNNPAYSISIEGCRKAHSTQHANEQQALLPD